MKVYLRKGHHSVYDDLIAHPPEGIDYTLPTVTRGSRVGVVDVLKKKAFRVYTETLNKPHAIYVNPGGASLIHACSGIMIKNRFPWVIDSEHVSSFVGFQEGRLEKRRASIEKLLSSPYCKKIMPWSQAGMQSIANGLDTTGFKDKIEVVYPAIMPAEFKRKKHDGTNLLFVSVRFFTKGGKELLAAYDILREKHDVSLTIVSDVPDYLKNKYREDKNVKFLKPDIPREKILSDIYASADLLVVPSYMDTFGMVFLEAMAAGLPIVTTDIFAIPEIVGQSGVMLRAPISYYNDRQLIDVERWNEWKAFESACEKMRFPEFEKQLALSIAGIIDDARARKAFAASGRRSVETTFSVDRRNRQLKRIYEEALKS